MEMRLITPSSRFVYLVQRGYPTKPLCTIMNNCVNEAVEGRLGFFSLSLSLGAQTGHENFIARNELKIRTREKGPPRHRGDERRRGISRRRLSSERTRHPIFLPEGRHTGMHQGKPARPRLFCATSRKKGAVVFGGKPRPR